MHLLQTVFFCSFVDSMCVVVECMCAGPFESVLPVAPFYAGSFMNVHFFRFDITTTGKKWLF